MEHNDFMEKYFTDVVELKIGSEVEATVIVVEENYLILDLNSNVEGKIYLDEYTNDKSKKFTDFIKVGDVITARVNKIIDGDNNIAYLSRKHILEEEDFKVLVEKFNNKENISAVVVKSVHKGAILKYKDIELFMHESQFGDIHVDDAKGKSFVVEIQSVDTETKKVRVSRSQVLYKEKRQADNEAYHALKAAQDEEASKLQVGDVVSAKLIDVKDKFAIAEIGANRAILPISQLDHKRYEKISDLLKVGATFQAKVMENHIDEKGRRKISISRKALIERAYDVFKKNHEIGTVVEATVDKKMSFGVVCNLDTDVTGLLHFSEFSYNPKDRSYNSLTHGTKVEVKIISYVDEKEKIGLSIKQMSENPWSGVSVKAGDVVSGVVTEIPERGSILVEVQGVEAYLPFAELSHERIGKAEDVVKVGETIECKVLDCNIDRWYMKLSLKALEEVKVKEEFVDTYDQGADNNVTLGDVFKDKLN